MITLAIAAGVLGGARNVTTRWSPFGGHVIVFGEPRAPGVQENGAVGASVRWPA